MLIENDVEVMSVEKEIEHMIRSLNSIIKKVGCKNLIIYNKETLEDIAFLEIYNNNKKRINAELIIINNNFNDENSYLILKCLLNSNDVAIVNTDTIFTERSNKLKINYNIEFFKDYSINYVKEIIKYYKADNKVKNKYSILSAKSEELLQDEIDGINLLEKYTNEEISLYREELPKYGAKKATLYNSIMTNYIKDQYKVM